MYIFTVHSQDRPSQLDRFNKYGNVVYEQEVYINRQNVESGGGKSFAVVRVSFDISLSSLSVLLVSFYILSTRARSKVGQWNRQG